MIETAGGQCIFPELRKHQSAKDRIVNPADVIAQADHTAHIPIKTHSLNAAMAATVALYEVTRMAAR